MEEKINNKDNIYVKYSNRKQRKNRRERQKIKKRFIKKKLDKENEIEKYLFSLLIIYLFIRLLAYF